MFQRWTFPHFLPKTSHLGRKRHFIESISFDTHSTANLPTYAILKKLVLFSKKKHLFFFKKTRISNVFRNLTISIAFYGEFAKVWWKKNSRSETWTNIVKAIGKHRVKNAPFEWKILLPYIMNMAENNNRTRHQLVTRRIFPFLPKQQKWLWHSVKTSSG